MTQFQYTAVNSAGKKLSGTIGAPSENDARKQLNTFGISILTIQTSVKTSTPTTTTDTQTENAKLPKFEFEAFDKTGQKVIGTIPASSRYKAFKRLVDEYQFEVGYIVTMGATPEEKAKAKQEDLSILKAEYEEKTKNEGKNEESKAENIATAPSAEFEKKHQLLLSKVDFILEKVKNILATYSNEIKPENKKIVQDYVDKLLRIKSSTNLEYIEHTSEKLLKKIQDQELFLHKEKMKTQRASLKLQTQGLIAELNSGSSEKKDVMDSLENLSDQLETSDSKLLKSLSRAIDNFLPSPEEKELKKNLKTVNRQVWTFKKLYFTSPKDTKVEAKASLDKVTNEKNRIKAELLELKMRRKALKESKQTVDEPLIIEEITHFMGWLLSFYLAAYFTSHYFLAKAVPSGNPLPGDFNILNSEMLRYLLISIFLWYVLLSIRIQYFKYKSWTNAIMIPLGVILNASIIFNL